VELKADRPSTVDNFPDYFGLNLAEYYLILNKIDFVIWRFKLCLSKALIAPGKESRRIENLSLHRAWHVSGEWRSHK
jgi:hypothetical protein